MSVETSFTPLASAAGGALIGLSAVILYAGVGRIAGISGIVRRALLPRPGDERIQAVLFIAGLIAAPFVWTLLIHLPVAQTVTTNLPLTAAAGLLVGFGAVLGGGCTSGHGVCGLSRLSPRSLVAVPVFMAAAAVTVFVVRHVIGGG